MSLVLGAIAQVGGTREDTGTVSLNITRSLDVLAIITPVLGRAEALGAVLAVVGPGHLDAVLGLEDMRAICHVLLCHWQRWIPELCACEVAGGVTFEAVDGPGRRDDADQGQESGQDLFKRHDDDDFGSCCQYSGSHPYYSQLNASTATSYRTNRQTDKAAGQVTT